MAGARPSCRAFWRCWGRDPSSSERSRAEEASSPSTAIWSELIDLFGRADSILVQTLDDPLSRDSLDLAARAAVEEDEAPGDDE